MTANLSTRRGATDVCKGDDQVGVLVKLNQTAAEELSWPHTLEEGIPTTLDGAVQPMTVD